MLSSRIRREEEVVVGRVRLSVGVNGATRGMVPHVYVRGGKSEKADWNRRFLA